MAAISYPVALYSSGCCSCSRGSSLISVAASSSAGRHVGRKPLRWVMSHRSGGEDHTSLWRNAGPGQWACNAHAGDNYSEGENPFDLEKEFKKALESEESQVLLRDLAAAAGSVSAKKQELDALTRREEQVNELQVFLERLDIDQAAADSVVSASEEDVLKAESELRAAELALVMARAGDSASEVSNKWETQDIDEDAERIESGKAAAVSALAGTVVGIPFATVAGGGLDFAALVGQVGILLSCALFGVTFRYAVRQDLGNLQLKFGVAAAFGLVRGVGQIDATQALVGFPERGIDKVLQASLEAGESMIIFVSAALALDFCLHEKLLSPFPSKKSRKL